MKVTTAKLEELKKELTQITKEVEKGRIAPRDAADRIIHIREEMDKLILHLRTLQK
jgi:hypothetical protein